MLSEAQRRVLTRGFCILYLDPDSGKPQDVSYRTWSSMIDRGWLTHEQSNLAAKRPWERYVVTRAGREALSHKEKDNG